MEVFEALRRQARQISDEVLTVLEQTQPELVADISHNGIVLTGGGSLLWGFDRLIGERTGISCSVATMPSPVWPMAAARASSGSVRCRTAPSILPEKNSLQSKKGRGDT